MDDPRTTLWENIKGRVRYLKENSTLMGDGVEIAQALTEELERLWKEIDSLKERIFELEAE